MTNARLVVAVLLLALTASCSKTATTPQATGANFGARGTTAFGYNAALVDVTNEPGTIFKVTYKPSTIIIDAATVRRAFAGASDDGKTWKFDGSPGAIAALKPGTVVLFSDLALLNVTGVRSENGQTIVDGTPAALTDAIADGEIRISHDIRFAQLFGDRTQDDVRRREAAAKLLNLVASPALADVNLSGEGVTYTTTIKDFAITAKANEVPGKLSFLVKASRSWEGIEILAQMKGEVTDFREDVDVRIASGAFQSLSVSQSGLSGFADFEVEGHKDAPGPGTLDPTAGFLGIPSIVKIPLSVGGIPITVGVGTAMLIRPAFTGKGEFVDFHYKFEFSGMKASWSQDAGTTTPTESNTPELIASRALSAIGPLGFIGALAAPRVDVGFGVAAPGIGTVNFGPSVVLQLILSGSITSNGVATSMLPCQVTRAYLFFKVSSKVSLLGVSVSGPSKTVQLGKRTWIDPAIEGCYKFAKETEAK